MEKATKLWVCYKVGLNISTQFWRQSAKRKGKKRKRKGKKTQSIQYKETGFDLDLFYFTSKRKNSVSGEQKLRQEKGGEKKFTPFLNCTFLHSHFIS